MTKQQFDQARITIANQLAQILQEIASLPLPEERAYFAPLATDAEKHFNDIMRGLIRESWGPVGFPPQPVGGPRRLPS